MTSKPFTWIELSRSALQHNAQILRAHVHPAKLMAVVKGNAYGLGMAEVARILERKVDSFGVASLDEAQKLRNFVRKPITVLSYWQSDKARHALPVHTQLVLHSFAQLQELKHLPLSTQKKLELHIKIDVGTSRIGFLVSEVPKLIRLLKSSPALQIIGVFSHFAESEEVDTRFTLAQNKQFLTAAQTLEEALGQRLVRHISCSASSLKLPETHHDQVRIGLGLFGLWPSLSTRKSIQNKIRLHPVLSWKTRVLSVKKIPAGSTIGYNRTFRAVKEMTIAILPLGYADGLDRRLSNTGTVLVQGSPARIVGRISMNLSAIDCTGIAKVKAGDEVVLIGSQLKARQGRVERTAEDMANDMRTINYEVLARLSPLLPRYIVK